MEELLECARTAIVRHQPDANSDGVAGNDNATSSRRTRKLDAGFVKALTDRLPASVGITVGVDDDTEDVERLRR